MRQAAQLRQIADALEGLDEYINLAQHISISVGVGEGQPYEVDIHGTQPEDLDSIAHNLTTETVQTDADGLVRYVTVKTDALEVTWHRR